MRKVFIYSLNLILLAFSSFASASEGDAVAGKLKVYTCTGCHGIEGYRNAYPNYRVPKINGQNREYITAALNAYKAGERQHPTMRAQGESLTEQDIADIAAYLSEAHTSGSP